MNVNPSTDIQVQDEIQQHRQALLLSGNLSNFHLTNLKSWPYILFDADSFKEVRVDYSFVDDDKKITNGQVIYDFVGCNDSFDRKKLEVLEGWVRVLFWSDTEVVFKKDGKKKWTKKKTN